MLAARNAVLSGEIQLEELKRLSGLVESGDGAVDIRLSFETRGEGWQALELRYAAELTVICQRCLEPMQLRLEDDVGYGIVAGESWAAVLPTDVEPLILDEDRLSPMQLVEDELIVSLPMAPRHTEAVRCAEPAHAATH